MALNRQSCYQHDLHAGEWVTTCPCCSAVIYTLTLREALKQFLKHTRTQCLNGY